ncbi:hypothetical protein DYE50_11525 [Treponema ruminis]|uniref:Glycosidase n=1 Tax=Treponema ruminis TaxID=744515 RepID=A0A7W8G8M0_9SPIR|nr:alpha-amylase family glycosyl hydrolase [Treponema ruminis]MBB5225892.1 glycosidase [Treponema ruminis]QSI03195.1 hypothetical protein DYE50_11525 [Treponema ruminis]
MKKISFRNILAGFTGLALFALPLASCANLSDSGTNSLESAPEYGSITINGGDSASRSLDVGTLTSASVTVSGYGIKDIVKNDIAISDGKGEGITIENIPVGRRVVTVKSNVDGAVLRAVCDVVAGPNSVSVNWASTAVGNVYWWLAKKQEISSIEKTGFETAIPAVHASLVNAEAIANDYPALKTAENYILSYGSVTVNYKNTKGYTVQVTDIASEKTTLSNADGTENLKGYPGEWKVKVFDEGGELKETKDLLIAAGKTTKINLEYGEGADLTGKTIIFVKANSAPDIWAWEVDGVALTQKTGSTWGTSSSATKMSAVTSEYMAEPSGWYMIDYTASATGKTIAFKLNWSDPEITGKAGTFWYDGSSSSSENPSPVVAGLKVSVENPQLPIAPNVAISPASGEISVKDSITVTLSNGNDTISDASVTISGDVSKTYSYSDFTNDVLKIKVGEGGLGLSEAGKSITVNASVTNSVKTVSAEAKSYTTNVKPVVKDTFTWDNVNCYFVLTDRFANGDTGNDHSYYRQNKDNNQTLASGYNNVATFHGGDIKGLTEKLGYLNNLGVNAIWITAPYEQAHGWCQGGGNGFPHYAFHGYYTQDWTYMDQNMGTIEEFRTFVNEAHKLGIRVVMDVVINHTGYNTVEDMLTYKFGNYGAVTMSHGWCQNAGNWNANPNGGEKGNPVNGYNFNGDYWKNDYWDNSWWGCWIRSFGFSNYETGGELCSSLAGLPDVRTEMTDSVKIPAFLKTKWESEPDASLVPSESGNTCGNKYGDYKLPSVASVDWYGKTGDWRRDKECAPTDYQIIWLSAWVREFGIDGFRCDTAKHVHMYRWGQLKEACQSALEAWRKDSSKTDTAGAKEWTENFWMTGECFDWKSIEGKGEYYTTGKFDSMIEFSIGGGNHWESSGYAYHSPSIDEDKWQNYLKINSNEDSDSNGNRNNVLTYISSHDTRLSRWSKQDELGTMFVLLPGGIQIYYGDETSREKAYTDCGDGDMATRGDFDWSKADGALTAHWGKIGNFRKYNPAVGAGSGSATKRTYTGKGGTNKVAIGINGPEIDVSNLFADGTTVYNWYDGSHALVSNGSVSFSGGSKKQPILVSERNPADYGLSF